jgi:cyclopropane fatty-acyl-phospholipid synthase-like methyltransferase
MSWTTYFDALQDDSPLYAVQSALYVESLAAAARLHHHQRVLDFGCGFGFAAALVAPRVREVALWDASPHMLAMAARHTAALPNVRLCDLSGLPAVETGATDRHAFDLVLVNSVVQYMTRDELSDWLLRWREMLAPGGRVLLSDLIAPDHGGLSDAIDLLRLGARHGSPLRATRDALGGLARYWRTSRAVPLTRISREDLSRRAAAAGLDTTPLPRNLTHFRRRWAAALTARPLRP